VSDTKNGVLAKSVGKYGLAGVSIYLFYDIAVRLVALCRI